jgi:hypothetical protein
MNGKENTIDGTEDITEGKKTGTYIGGKATKAGENGKAKIGFGVNHNR